MPGLDAFAKRMAEPCLFAMREGSYTPHLDMAVVFSKKPDSGTLGQMRQAQGNSYRPEVKRSDGPDRNFLSSSTRRSPSRIRTGIRSFVGGPLYPIELSGLVASSAGGVLSVGQLVSWSVVSW